MRRSTCAVGKRTFDTANDPTYPVTVDLDELRPRLVLHQPRTLTSPRQAAVAAILRPGEQGAEVLLIKRAEHPRDPWSGHMAFPGGRRDPGDRELLATAMRETREELGLLLPPSALLGQLDDVPTHRMGLVVRPYVFAIEGEPSLRPNHEVAETLWAPLEPLRRGERDRTFRYERGERALMLPAFDVEGRVVWGLTYRMLQSLFELLAPTR